MGEIDGKGGIRWLRNLQKRMCRSYHRPVGIQGRIRKEIEPEADSAGSSFGGKMVGMIKKVIAAAAIGKALSASISEGAALEQSLGGIETLFKDSADKVKANAAKAYQTAGMSANDYMELTTSFSASLLSSLAGDTSKAADVADMAMVDMSDNANKMGTNMEDIKNAYQGFAKAELYNAGQPEAWIWWYEVGDGASFGRCTENQWRGIQY